MTSVPTFDPSISPIISIPTSQPSITGLVISVGVTQTTTREVSPDDVNYIEGVIAEAYGVDIAEVSSVTEYATTGSMTVSVPETVSEEKAISEITESMSAALGVPVESITVSLDVDSGEVTYTITSSSYDETVAIVEDLEDPATVETFGAESDVVSFDSITPDARITAETIVILDADETTMSLVAAENYVEAVLGEEYSSTSEVTHVTSAPTGIPSFTPSMEPSSMLPSQSPSITGSVVFIEMTTIVTETLSDEDVQYIISLAEDSFGVYPGSVETEIAYEIKGSVSLSYDASEHSISEIEDSIENSMADSLGIHSGDVDVAFDPESGEFTYVISSTTANGAQALQESLQNADVHLGIEESLGNHIPSLKDVFTFRSFTRHFVILR